MSNIQFLYAIFHAHKLLIWHPFLLKKRIDTVVNPNMDPNVAEI